MDIEPAKGDVIERYVRGVREEAKPKLTTLFPLTEVPDSSFKKGSDLRWLNDTEPESLESGSDQLSAARLCLLAFQEYQDLKRLSGDVENFGIATKIVGNIEVTPVRGVDGRYAVTFNTTNTFGEDDNRLMSSFFLFDLDPKNVYSITGSPDNFWLFGEQGGEMRLLGKYSDILESSGSSIKENLEKEGWSKVGSLWAADYGTFAGHLEIPESK